jgi:hypothetical protein
VDAARDPSARFAAGPPRSLARESVATVQLQTTREEDKWQS